MSTRVLLALLLGGAATAHAQPLLPVREGTTWEYVVSDSATPGKRGRAVVRIRGSDSIREKQAHGLDTITDGALTKTEILTVDDRGVLCHRRTFLNEEPLSFNPPQTMVPATLKVGAAWELKDRVDGAVMQQQFRIVAEEEITVPAGTFRAFRFHCVQPWPISIELDRWFTPGIGLIKEITSTRGPTGRLVHRVSWTLSRFLPDAPLPVETPPPPTPVSTPSATAGTTPPFGNAPTSVPAPTPHVTLQIARVRDGEPATQFRSKAPALFVGWRGENLPVGAKVRIAWIAEDVGDLVEPNFVIDQKETLITAPESGGRLTLSRPADGWAAGKYRLDLYVDDVLLETVKVRIDD